MKKTYRIPLLFFCPLFLLAACDKNMSVPSYLYVDSVSLSTDYSTQGTASANVTDVWVTVNGKNLGVYELPATIPVLASGNAKVQLQAGIKKNGVSTLRPVYPFYTSHITYVDLERKRCDTLRPAFAYTPTTTFLFKEDFEDAGIMFSSVDSSIGIQKTDDKKLRFSYPKEPNRYSGCIALRPEDTYFEVTTNTSMKKQQTYTFLEMNYNITENMEIGIYYHYNGRAIQTPICGIYRTGSMGNSQWKKIYVNLTEAVNANMYVTKYEVYLKAVKSVSDSALFLFDNIKIVNM
ncbi:MAG: hypothetical protein J5873_07270 [Bacteroidales bacterium]|nr:hypothetical protein [Bacteroidales bacterium]